MSPNSPITLIAVVSAIPGIERRISYSGRGLANSINCSKTCSRRFVNLISSCALYLTSSMIGEVFEMAEFVVVGAAVDNNDKVTYIDNDNKELGQEAVNFLRAKGHQKIGFVTDDLFGQVGQEHYQGYIEATNEFNLETYPELVFSSIVIDSLIESLQFYQLTALIIKDDLIALRFIHWLNNQGIRIPEDYAIISFNNSIFAEIMHPFLTTYDINIKELGKESVQRLLDLLKNPQTKAQKITIPFRLIERESVSMG